MTRERSGKPSIKEFADEIAEYIYEKEPWYMVDEYKDFEFIPLEKISSAIQKAMIAIYGQDAK